MKLYRKVSLLFLLLLMTPSLAITYSVNPVNDRAFPGENLKYSINFTNDGSITKNVYINKFLLENTFGNPVIVDPSINIILGSGESTIVNFTIPISKYFSSGLYRTPVIMSYDDETDRVFLDAVILSNVTSPLELREFSVTPPETVVPIDDFNITVTLICTVEAVYPLVNVVVSSDEEVLFESSSVVELFEGINVFEKTVKLPANTMPGVYDLLVEAEVLGELLAQGFADLVVDSYVFVNESSSIREDVFGKRVIKSLSNDGTEIVNVSVNYTASLIEPLLLSKAVLTIKRQGASINSTRVLFSNGLINETVALQPGDAAELVVDFNYGLLLLIPFIVILSVIGWVFLSNKVSVNKDLIESFKEGGYLLVKVGIRVKNTSIKKLRDVRIIEDLPVYAKKAGGFGTIRGEVDKDKGVIVFNVGDLDPKEEVMVSYTLKTDVELIGRVSLPPSIVKYVFNRRVKSVSSNTPIIRLIKRVKY